MNAFTTLPSVMFGPDALRAQEAELRARIAQVARKWIGTPYFPRQARCGVGADCGSLLLGVYRDAGIINDFELSDYDWMSAWAVRGGDRLYLESIKTYLSEVSRPKTGDVAHFRIGRGWSHSAIVIEWPREIIHAARTWGVIASPGTGGQLAQTEVKFWSLF